LDLRRQTLELGGVLIQVGWIFARGSAIGVDGRRKAVELVIGRSSQSESPRSSVHPVQPERLRQEDRHLGARHVVVRTVVAASASTRDARCRECLDKLKAEIARLDVSERRRSGRRTQLTLPENPHAADRRCGPPLALYVNLMGNVRTPHAVQVGFHVKGVGEGTGAHGPIADIEGLTGTGTGDDDEPGRLAAGWELDRLDLGVGTTAVRVDA
jgi:hypothetical protein